MENMYAVGRRKFWKRKISRERKIPIPLLAWVESILVYIPTGEPIEGVPHVPKDWMPKFLKNPVNSKRKLNMGYWERRVQ